MFFCDLGAIPVRNAAFGEGSGSILLDNLICEGHESSLLECVAIDQLGVHNCEHSEDAGVRCEGTTPHYTTPFIFNLTFD